ncbi:MAG: lipoyl synthase [Nitrospirota bacterium]
MRLPEWIRVKAAGAPESSGALAERHAGLHATKSLLRGHRLSTVCEEARCPNRGYCFSKPTATFMILGDCCTRDCAFCAVATGAPSAVDAAEPERVAEAAHALGLKYVVITSVTRDDLPDGGAAHFAATITAVRSTLPDTKIEVLTPDFKGDEHALQTVLEARPDVFNHNIETVKRLYARVRPQADYERSLQVLQRAKEIAPDIATKSGLMVGLGETESELLELFGDLRQTGCSVLTIGQYLRPTKKNLPVVEYIKPEIFNDLKERALALGFAFVASGPLVRSSMNAEEMYNKEE